MTEATVSNDNVAWSRSDPDVSDHIQEMQSAVNGWGAARDVIH
jgi:hypothetical protein